MEKAGRTLHWGSCKYKVSASLDVTLIYTFCFTRKVLDSLAALHKASANILHLTFIKVQIDYICKYKPNAEKTQERQTHTGNCLQTEVH